MGAAGMTVMRPAYAGRGRRRKGRVSQGAIGYGEKGVLPQAKTSQPSYSQWRVLLTKDTYLFTV